MIENQVALVTAGAGTGKTTLVAGWVTESSRPVAWVSLDTTDRDIGTFWGSIIVALQSLVPGCGDRAVATLRQSSAFGSVTDAVGDLLDDLDDGDCRPSVLVIDDLHLVDDVVGITRSFDLFVRHLPPWLHLVLLARRDLAALPRDRLRAQGRLGELRFAELRFSPEESHEMLRLLAPTLSSHGIDSVIARADGWAAGLRMAALTARTASAQGGGETRDDDDRLVHDFVLQEVLAAESPDLLEFLSAIAPVVRVNESLAAALTDRPNPREYLSRTEARGLFVDRLGIDGWFQMHSLARAALTAQLASRSADQLAEQHARAARWFEEMGEIPLSLEHWLLAQRPRDALRLLAAKAADLYDSGREATIRQAMCSIAPIVVTGDVQSMIEFAWCQLLVDRRRFTEIVEQLSWRTRRSGEQPVVRRRVVMLQSMAAGMNGRWADGGALAREALGEFGDFAWRDPFGRFGWNMVAREIALGERWDDGSEDVREARLALGRDPKRRLTFEGTRATRCGVGRSTGRRSTGCGRRTARRLGIYDEDPVRRTWPR